MTTAKPLEERDTERPSPDPFVVLVETHPIEIATLLRAVAYDAVLTLGPGTEGQILGTLERGRRSATAHGATIATVLVDLSQRWEK